MLTTHVTRILPPSDLDIIGGDVGRMGGACVVHLHIEAPCSRCRAMDIHYVVRREVQIHA